MNKFTGTTRLAALASFALAAASAQADTITLTDAGFENGGSSTVFTSDYKGWGNAALSIISGSGGGNEGKWLLRGTTSSLANGPDLRDDTLIAGKTDDQYAAYASGGDRGMFQYVSQGTDTFTGAFELKVDVGSTATARYNFQVVGFNNSSDVTLSVINETAFAGTGGFEVISGGMQTISSSTFSTKTLSGSLVGTYDNIGILLLMDQGTNNDTGDMVGFDNVRLTATVIPEPGTYALLAGCFALTAVMVRRRQR